MAVCNHSHFPLLICEDDKVKDGIIISEGFLKSLIRNTTVDPDFFTNFVDPGVKIN